MRYCKALDLVDDAALIAEYEKAHEKIWPQVRDHLRAQGVVDMEIYRLGTRLFMIMDVDDTIFDADAMAESAGTDALIVQWEALMWHYQKPTPWTPAGEKWISMCRIFDLRSQ
jgi:L-rhamnose mutarotase